MENENQNQVPEPSSNLAAKLAFSEVVARLTTPRPDAAQRAADYERRREASHVAHRSHDYESILDALGLRYRDATLDGFQIQKEHSDAQAKALLRLRAYCDNLLNHIKDGTNLVLYGPVGTGKDHLMVSCMKIAMTHGVTMQWMNGLDFYGRMRDRIADERTEEQVMVELAKPSILCISDPLCEGADLTGYQKSTMFRVIDRRYRDMRPVWVTMNVSSTAELGARAGFSIAERLKDRAVAVPCNWPSYRKPLE